MLRVGLRSMGLMTRRRKLVDWETPKGNGPCMSAWAVFIEWQKTTKSKPSEDDLQRHLNLARRSCPVGLHVGGCDHAKLSLPN